MRKFVLCCFMVSCFAGLQAQTGKDAALSSLGTLSAFSIYDAYCVIGSIADGFANDTYKSDYVTSIADEQVTMLTNLSTSLNTLNASGFITDKSDVDYIASINDCLDLLQKEAAALKTYIADPTTANSDAFQDLRNRTWTMISTLLGIK